LLSKNDSFTNPQRIKAKLRHAAMRKLHLGHAILLIALQAQQAYLPFNDT
jgi:hypothetical protein